MNPIRPPFGTPTPLASGSGTSAARAVADGFVAVLAMAVEPLTSATGGRKGHAPSEADAPPSAAEVVSEAELAAETSAFGFAAAGEPSWTPLPAPRSAGPVGWTPMPAPQSEGKAWAPTLPWGVRDEPMPLTGVLASVAPSAPLDAETPPSEVEAPVVDEPLPDWAPSASVPHGRTRGRATVPPAWSRSAVAPGQRAGWVPGGDDGTDAAPLEAVDGVPDLVRRHDPPGPRRAGRPGTAEPPTAPPQRRRTAPGTDRPSLPRFGPAATPISPERRAARYAQTAADTDVGFDPALSTPLPPPEDRRGPAKPGIGSLSAAPRPASGPDVAGTSAAPRSDPDPAHYVTPFQAYERQQGPRVARALGAAPTADPAEALTSPVGPPPDPDGPETLLQPADVPADPDAMPVDPGAVARDGGDAPAARATAVREALPPDPDAAPLPPASARPQVDERVRVQLHRDLAVEVSTRGNRVDVTVAGSAQAVDPLRDLGPELDAGLAASGFQLGMFDARGDRPQGDGARDEQGDKPADEARPAERNTASARRSRFGRYA